MLLLDHVECIFSFSFFSDSSGFIFDLQSNTVLAQGGAFENMKEKVSLVTVGYKLECHGKFSY